MTENEMRIAVAESTGKWKHQEGLPRDPDRRSWLHCATPHVLEPLPNYPKDLNAMHEMEKTLSGADIVAYTKLLIEFTGSTPEPWMKGSLVLHGVACMNFACSTAPQRCEAYLRAKGLWRDTGHA